MFNPLRPTVSSREQHDTEFKKIKRHSDLATNRFSDQGDLRVYWIANNTF